MSDDQRGSPGSGDPDGGPGGDEVGSVGEEAAKLIGALSEWAREHGRSAGHGDGRAAGDAGAWLAGDLAGFASRAARAAQDVDAHIATDDPECRWCPVCRTIHLVRGCTPEVRDQLAVAAAHLMQAAAGFLVSASTSGQRDRGAGEHVQHIDLDDGPDGSDGPGPGNPDPDPGPGAPGGAR